MAGVPDLLSPIDNSEQLMPEAPPSAPSMLADQITQVKDRERQDFVYGMQLVRGVSPDQMARATALERATGIPAEMLQKHSERLDELLQGNKYAALFDSYQRTAQALRDGRLASLAQDDVDNLARVEAAAQITRFEELSPGEQLLNAFKSSITSTGQAAGLAATDSLERQRRQFDRIDAEVARAAAAGEQPFPAGDNPVGFGFDYLQATPEQRVEMRDRLLGQQQRRLAGVAEAQQELEDMPQEPGAIRAQELGGDLAGTAEALAENPGFAARTSAGAVASSVEMLLAGALGGVVPAAAVGYSGEFNAKLTDVLREAGVDLKSPKAVLEALQNDELMGDARVRAARKAAGTTAVDVVTMGLAGRLLVPTKVGGRTLTSTQRELVNLGVQFPVQGVGEGLSEAAGQYAADQQIDAGDVLLEAIAGAGTSSVDVAVFGGGRIWTNINEGLAKARMARQSSQALAEMADSAVSSKLRGRDLDAYQGLAEQQLAGGDMESIWIPAESLQRLNQSGAPLAEIMSAVPGMTEQFAEAEARGGSVTMKTSEYLTYFADYHEQLAPTVRTQVDGLSEEDAVAWQAAQEAEIEQLAAELQREPDERDQAMVQLLSELQQAGFRRADAEQYATTHLAALSTLADRTGKSLGEMMERFPLAIRNQAPEQVQAIPVDDMRLAIQRLRAGDIPQSRDLFGKSLVEYLRDAGGLNDAGGEIAALDADFGRIGRMRLVRSDGISLDDAAMRAWERGYFPGVAREDVGPQLIVDAVRDDLNDSPRFSVEQENATLRDQADYLERLQKYLNQLDVDLDELTDDQVLALLRDQGEQIEGRQLQQSDLERALAMTEDDYIAAVSPSGTRTEDGDVVLVHIGDMERPANSRRISSFDDSTGAKVDVYRDSAGTLYAEQDGEIVGQMESRDGETLNIVAQEVQGRGIGTGLAMEMIRQEPFAQAGSFSDAGERTRRAAFRRLQGGVRRLNQGAERETHQQLSKRLVEQNPGLKLDLLGRGNRALLSRIELPKDGRQQGSGTRVMLEIADWADANGVTVSLSPSSDFGGNKKRLVEFYKRFGFVENKGGNRDFEISEAMYRTPRLEQVGEGDQARGFITFGQGASRRFQITLTNARDLSTVLHEFGHYYLEVMTDLAADADAPQQIRDDFAAVQDWVGAKPGEQFTTEQHEQFARGFEKYLAEGKAPNPDLQGAFARFKRWLISIYKDLRRLNVELTPEIRGVFDRLVATDQQIKDAEAIVQAVPMFESAAAAGMTEAEFNTYREQVEAAADAARTSVEQQIIREEERRRSKWWREESARVRAEVEEEIDTLPEYQAIKALRTGVMPDGSTANLKLQSAEIRERYGVPVMRRLFTMHAKDGKSMDVAAMMLGYESGDQMVKAILGAVPRGVAIRQETEARMIERHGPMASGESAERAMDAVHNEKRAAVLIKELHALGKQGNRRNITSQEVMRQAAQRIMQQRRVRDIQPFDYQRAEGKAARAAFSAAASGDLDAAYQAKQEQLLNFHLWREASKARRSIDQIVERMSGYNRQSKREKLGKAGADYLEQVDAVMEQYEFRTRSLRDVNRRNSFAQWYADQVSQGNDPFVPEFVLNTSQRMNYKDLSLEQLTELDEFVANIDHLSKLKNKLLANKRLRDFEETKNLLVRSAYQNLEKQKKPPIDRNTMSFLERWNDKANDMSSSLLKMEQIVEWLDGGDVDGPWSTAFWQPFVDAQVQKDDLNREFSSKLMTLVDAYTQARGVKAMHEQIHIPAIGQALTRNAIISAALNTGNASNRDKLLKGYGWSDEQLSAILQNMSQADWDFAQSLWDLVEGLWPQIEQLEKDLHGIPPDKVQPVKVVTPFGEYAGGYWPLVYDTSAPEYAGVANNLTDGSNLFEVGYAKATTPKGHTKSRVDSFAAPIMLDTSIVASHLGQVIHDLTHRLAIRDAAKIISNREVKQALNETLGVRIADQFNPWLQGVANDMVMDSRKGIDFWTRLTGQLRANLSVAWMGFSVTTAMQQILGFSQSFEYMSQKGGKRYLFQGLQEFVTHPFDTIEFVQSMSGEMRNRVDNLDQNMREVMKRISGKTNKLALIQRLAFRHIGIIQSMVDYPTWLAGYHQAMDRGETSDVAVAAGDRAVRLSQMAAGPKDLAAVQRKDGLMKALTIVYSYFNLLYNRQVDIKRAMQSAKGMRDYLNAFERTMFLIAIPSILGPLVAGQGPGDDEDWRKWVTLKLVTYPLMGVPLVRDVASALESGWGYRGATPIGSVGETLTRLSGAVTADEPDAERVTLNLMDLAAYGFGLPAAQPKRTVKYLFDYAGGESQDDNLAEFIHGVLFGPPKKD